MASEAGLPADVVAYYNAGHEHARLEQDQLERLRTQEIITHFAPTAPAVVLDIGGGTGPYAYWLAEQGYTVHLIDGMPFYVSSRPARMPPVIPSLWRACVWAMRAISTLLMIVRIWCCCLGRSTI